MVARRFVLRASVLCMVSLLSLVWCGAASAKLLHPFVSSFGSFSSVQGIATDAAGNVYVYDGGAAKIYKFDASGKPVNFAATGTNSISSVGFASEGEGEIAIDASSGVAKGDIYVAHAGSSINVYSAEGSKLGELAEGGGHPWGEACGVAVDPSGNVYAGLYPGHVNEYSPSANPVTSANYVSSLAGLNEVCNVAVDAAPNVFAVKWSNGPVTRYEPTQFGSLSATGSLVDAKGSTLAVDPASQEVYVDEKGEIAQYGPYGEPFQTAKTTFGSAGEGAINGSLGIAVGSSNHYIYVSDGKGKVSVFGAAINLPTVSTGEASHVGQAEADVSGTVNPEGVTVTGCQFEYGTTVSYGHTVSCPTNPGAGNEPVAESASLTGLEPGTEYHYRLHVVTGNGPSDGEDQKFATAMVWPETITGLPDGRVYELVSPLSKHGGEALSYERPAFVSPNGQAVMYPTTNAVEGASNNSARPIAVAERTSHGWVTRSAMPLPGPGPNGLEEYVSLRSLMTWTVPSADLSHLLFETVDDLPYVGAPDEAELSNNLYLSGPDPTAEPEWIAKSQIEGYPGGVGATRFTHHPLIAGASPDLKTIYFYYGGTLFPGASHLYRYTNGVLSDAGVLPGEETSESPALPAAFPEHEADFHGLSSTGLNNDVSADGSRIFFVRQDEAGTLELYARLTAAGGSQSTVLVSQSQLAGHVGEPSPDGPLATPSSEWVGEGTEVESRHHAALPFYVYADEDGSRAFFQSADRLTEDAPAGSSAKTYVFDLETSKLEYLPLVTGSIVTVSGDGLSLLFENTMSSPDELERWVAGTGGGSVTPVAQLPAPSANPCGSVVCVGPAYTSSDGSVIVFNTESPIPGFNDGGTHHPYNPFEHTTSAQNVNNTTVFRYDATTDKLSCLSCPPRGVQPASDALLDHNSEILNLYNPAALPEGITPSRAMSPDGDMVFFQTRDPLVAQDTNGTTDVYEWHDGAISLISSGHNLHPSVFVGMGVSGADVFFMTAEGIVPGDNDGAYDVYDARIPRPGDNPPPEAVPCEGAVCQGPPSVPNLLGQPASEAFNGAGNLMPPASTSGAKAKSLTRAQKLARALAACKRRRAAGRRKSCERRARRIYGAKASRAPHAAAKIAHNGRGK